MLKQKDVTEIINTLRTAGQELRTIDAKQELVLKETGDKTEIVKDIIAMANNGEPSYIIIGLQDVTFKDVGKLFHHYDQNTINQILTNKIDPAIAVQYKEFTVHENEYALLKIDGQDCPYLVAQDVIHNKNDRKRAKIHKGTIFVRHEDRTVGISRVELDKLLNQRKPDIRVSFERYETKVARKKLTLLMYVENFNKTKANNLSIMLFFNGCTLFECPEGDHMHAGDHSGEDIYSKTSLVYKIPFILGEGVSRLMKFTLFLNSKEPYITTRIEGEDIEKRDFWVKINEIPLSGSDQGLRYW